jgi:hypothetical protein
MTDRSKDIELDFPPLPCNKIVYRSLTKRRWINEDTGQILPSAFHLRKDKLEIGVSVNVISPQDCVKIFNKCTIVASLHVGRVRDLGLDVVQDKDNHANIIGLPYPEDDLAVAENLGGLLAKQARIIQVER